MITSSVTKRFGLGSLRIGWLVGPAEFVDRARSVGWHVPVLSAQNAGLVANLLEDAPTWAERSRDVIGTNHDLLASFVADRKDLDGFVAPGCPYAFLAHVGADGERTEGDRVAKVANQKGLLVVPGKFFDAPEYFRVSLGGEPSDMRDALATLGTVLDRL